ncbi:tetratricopeptide repeat protein [Tropicimonas isoalkanivorans]|uniref:Tetratricopeptide repeat-containing protein n=1 Tax=Tropicimonas isoalkanivorans TaxID=441112 RepID=A0A1I1KC51_9RHOB|nr:tetratricopeptide repeat-containing glycosyltransferase family protein [Tropicimonas isoalkanivorans]SFC58467.1 Tetratricopeptide repeat-containing protein [Tropicimonas isoalkanivorans]
MGDETDGDTGTGKGRTSPDAAPGQKDVLRTLRLAAIEHHKRQNRSEAAALYAKYLNQRPEDATIWTNLGVLMRQTGQREQALDFQQRAHRLRPDLWIVRNNLANSLGDFGRHGEAADLFRGLLKERPEDSEAVWNLGRCLRSMGRYEAAVRVLKAGLEAHPRKAQIRLQLALTQLAAGDLAEGFRNYEVRFETGEVPPPKIDLPLWDGEPLHGKSLLVVQEQGLGDSLLCARFLPGLREQGARVHVVCRPPVRRLFAGAALADGVSTKLPDLEGFDAWAPMFDLPRHHFARRADIPKPAVFAVPQQSLERADSLVRPHDGALRIGVVWSGSVTYKANHLRSFGHEAFLPLADIPGVRLFSLYKGPLLEAYRKDGSSALIIDASGEDADLADCAATISRMHLVITADTAVAHLAASLGTEVWCLLHWDPFWLYGHTAENTPWYPRMRLFRQRRPMDWDEVFDRVRGEVEDWTRGALG